MKLLVILLLLLSFNSNAQPTVRIIMFDNIPNSFKVYVAIRDQITEVYGIKNFSHTLTYLPDNCFSKTYNRYRADKILYSIPGNKDNLVLGITHKDISTTKGNHIDWGVMGLSSRSSNSAIVSSYRCKTKKDLVSTALHELGHLLNLNHCNNYFCLMSSYSGSYVPGTYHLCNNCRTIINKQVILTAKK